MNSKVGLWIDHRKSVIVFMTDSENTLLQIQSIVEEHLVCCDGTYSTTCFESHLMYADDMQVAEYSGNISIYYDKLKNGIYDRIIETIDSIESILIFGPGEIKNKVIKHLSKTRPLGNFIGIETNSMMTIPQIKAYLQLNFLKVDLVAVSGSHSFW